LSTESSERHRDSNRYQVSCPGRYLQSGAAWPYNRAGARTPLLSRRSPTMKLLTAIPVYNEERHVQGVLHEVRRYSPEILVVNDGSTDRTAELLAQEHDLHLITHSRNRGYAAALISAFAFALEHDV